MSKAPTSILAELAEFEQDTVNPTENVGGGVPVET